LFEFTPRKNTILNIGGAWFALKFSRIFCKGLEFSYFVVQPHGFKHKLDEVFKVFLANAILLSFQRLSCKRIHENGKAFGVREYLSALGLVKAVFVEAHGDHLRRPE